VDELEHPAEPDPEEQRPGDCQKSGSQFVATGVNENASKQRRGVR
jgi:hypothetical protein